MDLSSSFFLRLRFTKIFFHKKLIEYFDISEIIHIFAMWFRNIINPFNETIMKKYFTFIIIILTIVISVCNVTNATQAPTKQSIEETITQEQKVITHVTLTCYQPVEEQCNSDYLHTADNSFFHWFEKTGKRWTEMGCNLTRSPISISLRK